MVSVSSTPPAIPGPGAASDRFLARSALAAFARSPRGQADVDQVMRALSTHENWFVPVAYAERSWGQHSFTETLAFPGTPPAGVLTAFTDTEAARQAEGQPIGPHGGPVSGVRLLRSLGRGLESFLVNPGSPNEHQWFIATAGFDIAHTWASAIEVERSLAERGNGPVPVAALRRHRFHLLVEAPNQTVVQVMLPEIGAVAVCFTATDRIAEYLASLPPAVRLAADFVAIDGPRLFELVRGFDAAGIIINAGSDDQTALAAEDIIEIVSAEPTTG